MSLEINTDEFWADQQMQKPQNEKCYLAKVQENMQIDAALANPLGLLKQIKQLTTERDRLRAALEVAKDALEQLRHKAWQKAYPAEQLRANSAIHTIGEALKGQP